MTFKSYYLIVMLLMPCKGNTSSIFVDNFEQALVFYNNLVILDVYKFARSLKHDVNALR